MVDDIVIDTRRKESSPQFSIVLPVHNEEDSLEIVITEIYEELSENIAIELILSEDGSTDNTKEIIKKLSKKIPLKALLSETRKGYAFAIKDGLKHVSSSLVFITDSDGQHKPLDFWKLKNEYDKCEFNENVIISGSRMIRSDATHRIIMSKIFQKLCSTIFDLPPIKDITSSFKLMNTEIAKSLSSQCKYMKESFWSEFIIRAVHNNVKIIELPVEHTKRQYGETVVYKKTKIVKIAINQIIGIIRLKTELSGDNFFSAILKTKAIREIISFFMVGSSGAIIILFLTWLGVNHGLHYTLSATIGIETSIFWAFLLNDKITFKNVFGSSLLHRFLRYQITSMGGLAINLTSLYLLTSMGTFYLVSELLGILFGFLFNFYSNKKWVWRK